MNDVIGKQIANDNDKLDMLESLIDSDGLDSVIDLLAKVASAKADHILCSYSDSYDACDPEADRWDSIVVELLKLERKLATI